MATDTMERPAAAVRNYYPASADMGEEKWLDVGGIRTRYFDQGEGERIVMIHGAQFGARDGASSAKTWALNFPVLKAWHNVDRLRQARPGLHRQSEIRRRLHHARHRAACHRLSR